MRIFASQSTGVLFLKRLRSPSKALISTVTRVKEVEIACAKPQTARRFAKHLTGTNIRRGGFRFGAERFGLIDSTGVCACILSCLLLRYMQLAPFNM